MFRAAFVLLAKKKPAAPPKGKKILKRLGRTASKSGRGSAAKRRLTPTRHKSVGRPGDDGAGVSGIAAADAASGGAAGAQTGSDGDALVHVSSEEGRTPQASAMTSHAAARAMTYRLATAVSTVVVPPLANAYLESMKQTLTPAVRRPQDGGLGGGGGLGEATPVSQMEEYYTSKKGPLFATAVIAGTNAVKQASMLIPFCHPIPIQKCSFTFRRRAVGGSLNHSALPHRVVLRKRSSAPSPRPSRPEYSVLYCFCTVATEEYKTGVEMEALTGATVAAMTLYDMLKGLPGAQEDGLSLGESFVLAKRGGKNDFIKLLMSEPERPEPAKTSRPAITDGASEAAPVSPAAKAGEAAGVEEEEAEEEPEGGELPTEKAEERRTTTTTTTAVGAAARGVVRKSVPASSVADDHDEPPGDSGAWWRSSRHEKKLQEMHPRRKYGDGARLAPIPTSAELKTKNRAGTPAPRHPPPAANEEEELEEEEEREDGETPVRGKAHGKAPAADSATKAKPKGTAGKSRAAVDKSETEAEEDEESVKPRKHRGGQLAKKTARALPPKEEPRKVREDDDDDTANREEEEEAAEDGDDEAVEEEEEEAVPPPAKPAAKRGGAKRKPAPKAKRSTSSSSSSSSKAAAARARAAQTEHEDEDGGDDEGGEDAVEQDEEDPYEDAAPSPARGRKGAPARSKAAARHPPRGRAVEVAAEEDEDGRDDAAIDGDNDDDEGEADVVTLGKDGRVRPVRHDSWDNQTAVEDEEEEEEEVPPPPPPPKSLKKKKKMVRRS